MNKQEIKELIMEDDKALVGALIRLNSFQTVNEKEGLFTVEKNDLGFNKIDAPFMTSVAEQYLKNNSLSSKQIFVLRKRIVKYTRQLEEQGFSPVKTLNEKTKKISMPTSYYKRAELKGEKIDIRFRAPKNDSRFGEMLKQVRSLPDRKYIQETRSWEANLSEIAVKKLILWEWEIGEELQIWYDQFTKEVVIEEIEVPGLKGELYPFQKEGVSYIESKNGRALIADEMGLGKTIQALAYLQLHPELRPATIVVPASVKLNWAHEIKSWIPDRRYQILFGRTPDKLLLDDKGINIINYDILDSWQDALIRIKPKVVIFDECHLIKNNKAQRTKAAKKIVKNVDHVIGLSGTPITNRPSEFFNAIKMISPGLFSFWDFMKKYCGAKNTGWGWDFTGATNTEELHEILTKRLMLRRLKKDVLTELPNKVRSIVPIEIDNRKEYNKASSDILQWIRANEGQEQASKAEQAEALVAIEKLKQLSVDGKLKSAIQWIDDFLDSDEKLVVFCTHKKVISALMDHFGDKAVKIDGSVSPNKRKDIVDQFQEDDNVRLFVGNIKAAGVGITLTASSNTCFLELGWTPGEHVQAEDRVHRIGQEADSVTAYYLIAEGTIEEDIAEMLDDKMEVLSEVLDGRQLGDGIKIKELLSKIGDEIN